MQINCNTVLQDKKKNNTSINNLLCLQCRPVPAPKNVGVGIIMFARIVYILCVFACFYSFADGLLHSKSNNYCILLDSKGVWVIIAYIIITIMLIIVLMGQLKLKVNSRAINHASHVPNNTSRFGGVQILLQDV